jgi:hypothetical protein
VLRTRLEEATRDALQQQLRAQDRLRQLQAQGLSPAQPGAVPGPAVRPPRQARLRPERTAEGLRRCAGLMRPAVFGRTARYGPPARCGRKARVGRAGPEGVG